MAADNIREIFRTDTVGEFMDKCNWNFGIISRLGGPRGLQGEQGETGARGRRGAMMHVIDGESMSGMDFDTDSANEILENLDEDLRNEIEDGDVAVFSNGWVCGVNVENDSITVNEPLFSIVGPQGERGATGASGDTLFTDAGDMASLNDRRQLLIDNTIYLPSNNSNSGGIVFSELEREGSVYNGMTNTKAHINFKNDGLSINSNNNIRIGTSSSINEINFNIGNGNDIMKVNNNGVNLYKSLNFSASTGKITKSGNIISLYDSKTTFNKDIEFVGSGKIKRGNNEITLYSDFTNLNKPIFFNYQSMTYGIGLTNNSLFIQRNLDNNNNNTVVIGEGFNILNRPIILTQDSNNNGLIFINTTLNNILQNSNQTANAISLLYQRNDNILRLTKYVNGGTTNEISVEDNLTDFSTPVKAMVNGESVFLGVPAYTMMTYPDTLPAPQGWERFEDNLILFTDGTSHDTTSFNNNAYNDTDSNFYIYYNDGETIGYQRIIAVNTLPSNFDVQPSNSQKISYNSTPKNTVSSKESMSEVLNMSSKLNITENSFEAILTFANTNDKGTPGSGNTPSTIPVYENLLRKIFRNRTINTYKFGMGKIVSDNQFAFYFPMPVAPTGFTYIFKTA